MNHTCVYLLVFSKGSDLFYLTKFNNYFMCMPCHVVRDIEFTMCCIMHYVTFCFIISYQICLYYSCIAQHIVLCDCTERIRTIVLTTILLLFSIREQRTA